MYFCYNNYYHYVFSETTEKGKKRKMPDKEKDIWEWIQSGKRMKGSGAGEEEQEEKEQEEKEEEETVIQLS